MKLPPQHNICKILIVEDEFNIAQDLRCIVSELGSVVMGMAKSVNEALVKLKGERPDLIFLDIDLLGDMNGRQLAEIIDEKYGIPYIYVTSFTSTSVLEEIKSTNPMGYVLKPFNERDIKIALELALSKISGTRSKSIVGDDNANTPYDTSIIGECDAIKKVLKKVEQVAPTDVTVLIQGETGTGKELFMKTLHGLSLRKDKAVIKVNCAALPNELIESILFGHERGSFTGATEKRLGKFELANKGTIFLDEIGELPLSSQAKLLRCLQEKEIETVGGVQTKKIDVRVIAATNRNLAEEVQKGTFRADLFFRLNIFPIYIPPLRDREEDIALIANHLLEKSAQRFQKKVTAIHKKTMQEFKTYAWPGNVRELQHVIERGVIMAEGSKLSIALDSNTRKKEVEHKKEFKLRSLEEMEREQIINTLYYCKGKVRGPGGAAEILKLHPNTLDFRIRKLGISKTKDYKTS